MVCIQATLGITTLLTHVDIHVALAHQGMALLVLAFAIAHWRGFIGEYPLAATSAIRD
jgi:cytochrome c oxidase assembly protein subunit 15